MSDASPAASLIDQLAGELLRYPPFAEMEPAHVRQFVAGAREAYYAPGEVILEPAMGPVRSLVLLRKGRVTAQRGASTPGGVVQHEAGDLFSVAALLGSRAVRSTYTAQDDCFCLLLAEPEVRALARASAPFADYLERRALHFFELARQALHEAYASEALQEQSLEASLATLPRKAVLTSPPEAALSQVLHQMHERGVGSAVVVDAQGGPQGILTRHDILGRVTLPGLALATPVDRVMSTPVHTLDAGATLQDAALLMSRHDLRHVPVCEGGVLINIVSERDLFALQRLSLKGVSTRIRAARDLATLQASARDIRDFARNLLGQGVHARQLTELISRLNDVLTDALVQLVACEHDVDLRQACWLAFGSEGRSEQTIATDQDNGLVFAGDDADAQRPRWLAFARAVNEALDACGYPLCKGNVMASNPQCCLSVDEWRARFAHWIQHGAPEDLLRASIHFDLRPIAGETALAQPLLELLRSEPARTPRFIKQMADNALSNRAPLDWLGALETRNEGEHRWLDLKLRGTALFVEGARLFALAGALEATGTRARLLAAAQARHVPPAESEALVAAFEFLQMLRLRVQLEHLDAERPNEIDVAQLNPIDHRVLKESMRALRSLQQRIELDYQR
ncbi:MAG: CBS domain-containing protein [Ideonella sp.]|nr:CBS domain-containing protein [Ideonella sp.]MCC7456197.1 CBS domain-containing protein [Nitrospira sp.]